MVMASASGPSPAGSRPSAENATVTSGSFSAVPTAAANLATIGCGVPAGASIAVQLETSKSLSGVSSATVGTAGTIGERVLVVTASSLRSPLFAAGTKGAI